MNVNIVHYITSKYLPSKKPEGEEMEAIYLPMKRTELPYDVFVIREDLEEEFLKKAVERGVAVLKLKGFMFDYLEDFEVGALNIPPRFT